LPGEHWRYPTQEELMVNGDLGGPLAEGKPLPPPQTGPVANIHGKHGFAPVVAETDYTDEK
jgi:hypothetical protein